MLRSPRMLAVLGAGAMCACLAAPRAADRSLHPPAAASGARAEITPAARPAVPRAPFARRYLLHLASGPFPGKAHPQALVHFPPSFVPGGPINLAVFLHGWNNCVSVVAGNHDAICDPSIDAGQGPRPAYGLIDAVDHTRKNVVLVVLQLAWDAPSGDDGTLAAQDGFRDIIAEILADLPPPAGPRSLADLGRIAVFSHSGAFVAAADILDRGGLGDHIVGVYLLDSLYGKEPSFDDWLAGRLLAGPSPRVKFADIYLPGCGTDTESEDLAGRLRGQIVDANRAPTQILTVDDDPADALAPGALRRAVLFKASDHDHDALPRLYFARLLASSLIPDGPSQ